MPHAHPSIIASLGGRAEVPREEVHAWELRRIAAVARKLELPIPTGDVAAQRRRLLEAKLSLGPARLRERLDREVRWADRLARTMTALVPNARRTSTCGLRADRGHAAEFVAWFRERIETSDAPAMLIACPDHYVVERRGDGQHAVLETTGGSPFAALFTIDYVDTASLRTPADPRFPNQVAGVARASNGTPIGGVRHQFRDRDEGGLEAHLTIEFPRLSLPRMLRQHAWHLACEFSNWIEASMEQPGAGADPS